MNCRAVEECRLFAAKYNFLWGVTKFLNRVSSSPIEQCLNLAAKNYLCYVSWLRMCQLFTVLTGVIFQC